MTELEQTIDSREVAEMIEKDHSKLLRDLRRYEEQFIEANIGFNDFFHNSEYKDIIGRTLPCYRITKKGCEFIAHKLTGTKGTIFTARYINRFHEMQDILSSQESEPELPWYIRKFRGRYIILERDLIQITGVDEKAYEKMRYKERNLKPGRDWNGWGWHAVIDKEKFKQDHGFEYGNNAVMTYFSLRGAVKILRLLLQERAITKRAYETVTAEIERKQGRKELPGYTARIAQIEGHKAAEPLIQIQIFGKSICNMQ